MKQILLFVLTFSCFLSAEAQEVKPKNKIVHADPVYEDLTTELGGEKGANEININFGYRNLEGLHHTLLSQLEFEYAPANNLGFELLIPFTAYFSNPALDDDPPNNELEFIQWTVQYTFFQSFERNISLAVGLENAFQSQDPYVSPEEQKKGFSIEHIFYQPFLTIGKNWNETYFLLFKGGPEFAQDLEESSIDIEPVLTSAFHFKFSQEDENFLGIEFNKVVEDGHFEMFIRPQLKIELSDKLNIGTTVGIPVSQPDTNWSAFIRVAYEL